MYEGGEAAALSEYEERGEKLREEGERVKARYRFYEVVAEGRKELGKGMDRLEKSEHPDLKTNITDECHSVKAFFDHLEVDLATKERWEDPGTTADVVTEHLRRLDLCMATMD